jgi:hypothetical protein
MKEKYKLLCFFLVCYPVIKPSEGLLYTYHKRFDTYLVIDDHLGSALIGSLKY